MISNSSTSLADSARHMVDEADRFLRTAAQSGDEKFDAMRDQFVAQVQSMRTQLDDLEDDVLHKVRRAARSTDLTVRSHPYQALGIAAALGLLIGLMASRR
ncbi:MAG: DUF883 domain-containing protein [Pseudomonadota bacterium]|jgi:ElaB/YqjD/DUF883 family membrane-anchored ribosome-binding protein